MQLALVEMQRRVQSRVPLPWISADDGWLREQQSAGRALVRFGDIPLDWTDFRLTLRQTADILRRFDALEPADHTAIVTLARDGNALEPIVSQWYNADVGRGRRQAGWPGRPRTGARAGAAAVSRAIGRGPDAARGSARAGRIRTVRSAGGNRSSR